MKLRPGITQTSWLLLLTCGWLAVDPISPTRQAMAQERPKELTMPGESFRGPLPELTEAQTALSADLRRDVTKLAGEIGERNLGRRAALDKAVTFVDESFAAAGYQRSRQTYQVNGHACHNIIAELPGTARPEDIVVIAAHYDSVGGCPGANDNGSGVAALLAIARSLADFKPERTLRFVALANEEPPYFQTRSMGSWVYADRCAQRKEKIVAMISLETIGYYSDKAGSQHYPEPLNRFYPTTGNFIGFVGDLRSEQLLKQVVGSFRKHAQFPSEGGALAPNIPGIGWSDHWSFWQFNYRGIMVTDSAPFRYPHYHKQSDTPDKVDYGRMARVVEGLGYVVRDLVTVAAKP